MSSINYFLTNKFLTFIVPTEGQTITKQMTTLERNNVIMTNGDSPAYAVINDRVAITIFCKEDYRSAKNKIYHHEKKNDHATIIANYLDKSNNHCILGKCAFVFDDDNCETRNLINEISKLIQIKDL
jgi:hypothetical protein